MVNNHDWLHCRMSDLSREYYASFLRLLDKKKLPRPACQEQILLYCKAIPQVGSYCGKTS
jgi:hypothetical protein